VNHDAVVDKACRLAQFLAVGSGPGGFIVSSPDGVTWTNLASGVSSGITSIAYGNNQFVAVGSGGTVLQSGNLAQPDFGPPVFLAGGGLQLTLNGLAGQTYDVEASADLVSWATLTNLSLTNAASQFVDFSGTNSPYRFYRALLMP
jgi:hypothetical protein